MSSSVLTYWQLPNEESDFLYYLETKGRILAVPARYFESKEQLQPLPIREFIQRFNPDQLEFGLATHVESMPIKSEVFSGKLMYGFEIRKPCTIGYRRGKLCGDKLGQSNLHAYLDYLINDGSTLIRKDPEFRMWAKSVFVWARRFTSEKVEHNGYPYRATKGVSEVFRRGEVQLTF